LATNSSGAEIDITNANTTASGGNTKTARNNDIYIQGQILNPLGNVRIWNKGGDIFQVGSETSVTNPVYVNGQYVKVRADKGSIGTSLQRLGIIFTDTRAGNQDLGDAEFGIDGTTGGGDNGSMPDGMFAHDNMYLGIQVRSSFCLGCDHGRTMISYGDIT